LLAEHRVATPDRWLAGLRRRLRSAGRGGENLMLARLAPPAAAVSAALDRGRLDRLPPARGLRRAAAVTGASRRLAMRARLPRPAG
jgi:hypothetical protein